jgi:hypothetical protein
VVACTLPINWKPAPLSVIPLEAALCWNSPLSSTAPLASCTV